MNKKIDFLSKVSFLFEHYCPAMSDVVRFWVSCQFALESNFGQSDLAVSHNNYCGMKVPQVRLSLNLNDGKGFAHFDSLEDCVIDYCYWLSWYGFSRKIVSDVNQFTRRIDIIYCPDSDYVDRVYSIYNQFKS